MKNTKLIVIFNKNKYNARMEEILQIKFKNRGKCLLINKTFKIK